MDFSSKVLVERTGIAQRASVKEQGELTMPCNLKEIYRYWYKIIQIF